MLSLVDFSRKPADSSSVPPTTKKSATVKNVPERGTRGAASASGPTQMRTLPTLPDSKIAFFINGKCQGVAFRELYDYRPLRAPADARKAQAKRRTREGAREHKENHFDDGSLGYFPLISLFNGARVRLNPGPDFAFPPPSDIDTVLVGGDDPPLPDAKASNASNRTWRPLCERYAEFMEEQWELDEMEEEHARVEAALRAVNVKAETEEKIERERKRAQASAKKRAKREEAASAAAASTAATPTPTPTPSAGHLNVVGAHGGSNTASTCTPQPEREQSADVSTRPLIDPAAAATSTSALPSYLLNELHSHVETDQTSTGPSTPGPQSAYGSEYGDGEAEEQEQEQEREREKEQEEDAPPDDLMDIYGDPAKLLQYRRAAAIRMEEEEDQ
jgi:COMPASS component BRE2